MKGAVRIDPKGPNRTKKKQPHKIDDRRREHSTKTGRGPRTIGERWPRQETDRKATTDRLDSAQSEDPVAKELRFDRVSKEAKNKHKAET